MRSSLAAARVHVAGASRVGSGIILALREANVGQISCNDPIVRRRTAAGSQLRTTL